MRKSLSVSVALFAMLIITGCLSEPDGLACSDGSALRLSDSRWLCDSENPARPLPVTSKVRYVDAARGNDTNIGSAARPWKTLVKAAATARADTTVLIRSGTYNDGPINILNSGRAGQPIVFKPDGFSVVTIKENGFYSIGNSHIIIAHLRFRDIRGDTGNAIRFEGPLNATEPPASNIIIRGNQIINTWSSGIAIWGVRFKQNPHNYNNIRNVVIESNLLELNTNGGANEIITVANGAVNVDVRYNTLRKGDFNPDGTPDGTGDEGVDFKEGVKNSRIYGNTFYGLSDKAIYIDGGRGSDTAGVPVYNPQTTGIDIFNNKIRDGWGGGIVITTEGQGDVSNVNIYNNRVTRTMRDGINVYQHPFGRDAGGKVDKVWVFNNTVMESGRETLQGRGRWGGIRAGHPNASVKIENNITWNNVGFDIKHQQAPNAEVSPINLCSESICNFRNTPQLTADGTPGEFSPAIDNGVTPVPPFQQQMPIYSDRDLCAVPRSQGYGWDLGALETLHSAEGKPLPYSLSNCRR